MPLKISAEPFAASGGMAGEGARKLLGAPSLGPLQIVVREAGQNSWDARRKNKCVRFQISLRRPDQAQWDTLRNEVFEERPDSTASRNRLHQTLDSAPPLLLEIADFGTKGLGGPTRADLPSPDEDNENFVNFVRNIGSGQHLHLGGGTYGFGKTSFYDLDPCATVLVDSLALVGNDTERRLIACHLGDEFTHGQRRYTGRHWWGAPGDQADYVEPLTDEDAVALADAIGLPQRVRKRDSGTTVCVLMAGTNDENAAAGVIAEALLWFFWPKMIAEAGAISPMEFALTVNGVDFNIPSPESFPPLDLFVQAWRELKAGGDRAQEIWCGNPKRLLGKLAIARGFSNDRRTLSAESIVPDVSSHVALMRAGAELVVKYQKGPALPNGAHEWAGVFITSSVKEIERAFAASEPPAHDNWIPGNLPPGHARTFVKMGLQRIGEAMHRFVFPPPTTVSGPADQPPLGKAAAILGSMLPVAPSDIIARRTSVQIGRRRRWQVSAATFLALEEANEAVDALFRVAIVNGSAEPLIVTARPGIVAEEAVSGLASLPDGGEVTVVAWENEDGEVVSSEPALSVDAGENTEMRVRIRIPGLAAVGVLLDVAD